MSELFIIFIIFMALWFASLIPVAGNRLAGVGGFAAFMSVLSLALILHVIHF